MEKITCKANAKLNLTLDITGTRDDGYHLMDMLMVTVSLHDLVTVTKKESGITVCCSDSTLPVDSRNIVYKAADAFFKAANIQGGCHISVLKNIPMQAGMGGGSSDGAAVIMALNELYGTNMSKEIMCDIGVTVGADLPFIIMGGTARVQGIGDVITALPKMHECVFVAAMPSAGISTKEAFAAFDNLADPERPDTDMAEHGIITGDYRLLTQNLGNAMEMALKPQQVNELKNKLLNAGADAACMTGSGAAVFGMFTNISDAVDASALLNCQGVWAKVCVPTQEGVCFLN